MNANPTRPDEITDEERREIEKRLATFDEDVKTASPWAKVEARLLRKLKTPQPH